MRKPQKTILILLLAVSFAAAVISGCAGEFRTVTFNGTVDLCSPAVSEYLALSADEALDYLQNENYRATGRQLDRQVLKLSWQGGSSPYTVIIATDADLKSARRATANERSFVPPCLVPGKKYYWRVSDAAGRETVIDTFVPAGVRWINAREAADGTGVNNVRDLGGWRTDDGRRVKYGMLYRGGALACAPASMLMDDYGRNVFENELGIKTEIDLRNERDDGGQSASALADCAYIKAPFTAYTSIFTADVFAGGYYDPATRESLQKIFAALAEPSTYPAYFHCLIGQDRTGTLAYLINGLLGVNLDDLIRDFELTAFSRVGTMDREAPFSIYDPDNKKNVTYDEAFLTMHELISSVYAVRGGALKDAICEYLTSFVGVPVNTISAIRELLLE